MKEYYQALACIFFGAAIGIAVGWAVLVAAEKQDKIEHTSK